MASPNTRCDAEDGIAGTDDARAEPRERGRRGVDVGGDKLVPRDRRMISSMAFRFALLSIWASSALTRAAPDARKLGMREVKWPGAGLSRSR